MPNLQMCAKKLIKRINEDQKLIKILNFIQKIPQIFNNSNDTQKIKNFFC